VWDRRPQRAIAGGPGPTGGPAGVAAIVSQKQGVETAFGGLEIAPGILAGTTEVTKGFVLDRGAIDRGESARAHHAGQLDGITPVGLDASASLIGNQGRGDDPADVPSCGELTREPRPAGAGLTDEDQRLGLGLERTDEVVDGAWPGADHPHIGDVSLPPFRSVGHCAGVVVNIQPDRQCARVMPG
jgi:hypothetical protein